MYQTEVVQKPAQFLFLHHHVKARIHQDGTPKIPEISNFRTIILRVQSFLLGSAYLIRAHTKQPQILVRILPFPYAPCMVRIFTYTFTIEINQMYVHIPYMEHLGFAQKQVNSPPKKLSLYITFSMPFPTSYPALRISWDPPMEGFWDL